MFAAAQGSDTGAGLANGALLLATVAAELATPRLLARIGYRWALDPRPAAARRPALVLLASPSFAIILAVNAARGVGFAITVTAGGALTAALIPGRPTRRGAGDRRTGRRDPRSARAAVRALGRRALGLRGGVRADRRRTAAGDRDRPRAPRPRSGTPAPSTGWPARLRNGRLMRPAVIFARKRLSGRRPRHLPAAGGRGPRRLGRPGRAVPAAGRLHARPVVRRSDRRPARPDPAAGARRGAVTCSA